MGFRVSGVKLMPGGGLHFRRRFKCALLFFFGAMITYVEKIIDLKERD